MFNIPSEDFLFRVLVTRDYVNFTDVDMYQHMNTAAYVAKIVDHRSAVLDRVLKVSLTDLTQKDRLGIVYRDIRIKFKSAALFEEEIEIASWDDEIGKASFGISFVMFSRETKKIRIYGCVDYAIIDLDSGRPKPIPATWTSSADRNLLLEQPLADAYLNDLGFNPELFKQLR